MFVLSVVLSSFGACVPTSFTSDLGDGYCDATYNNAESCYDGGDCCQHTCADNIYGCGVAGYSCQLQSALVISGGNVTCTSKILAAGFNYANCDGIYTYVGVNHYTKSDRELWYLPSSNLLTCVGSGGTASSGYYSRISPSASSCLASFAGYTNPIVATTVAADYIQGDISPLTSAYSQITSGVSQGVVSTSAQPGVINFYGQTAFPIVRTASSGKVKIAGAFLGSGHVIAIAHTSYVSQFPDNGLLTVQMLQWLANGQSLTVGFRSGDFSSFKTYLTSQSIATTTITATTTSLSVGTATVLVLPGSTALNATLIQNWIKAGGGVMVITTPWAAGVSDFTLLPGNQWVSGCGLYFDISDFTSGGNDAISSTLIPAIYSNGFIAARLLKGYSTKSVKMSSAEFSANMTVLTTVMGRVPYQQDYFSFWNEVTAILSSMKQSFPTLETAPLGASNPLLSLEAAILTRLPYQLVTAHPAAAYFPGLANGTTITTTVTILANFTGRDSRYLYSGPTSDVWRPLGVYAAPGAVITVTVPASAISGSFLTVRIGSHSDNNTPRPNWYRHPVISTTTTIKSTVTYAANPFGGVVFIAVKSGAALGNIPVTVSGGVASPFYTAGQTTDAEWDVQKSFGSPFGVMTSNKFMLVAPISWLRTVDNPTALLAYWDRVIDTERDLAGDYEYRRPELVGIDIQISAGYMHSGYPIGADFTASELTTLSTLVSNGGWGYFHEIGHNHQLSTMVFTGLTEVSTNWFTLYVFHTMLGMTTEQARPGWDRASARATYMAPWPASRTFSTWQGDAFLALDTYVLLQEGFTWDLFKQVISYFRQLATADSPSTDQAKIDEEAYRFSLVSQRNLYPFFTAWGFPVSDATKARINQLNLAVWEQDPMMKWHGAPLTSVTNVVVGADTDPRATFVQVTVQFTRAAQEIGNNATSIVTQYVVYAGNSTVSRSKLLARQDVQEGSSNTITVSFDSASKYSKLTVVAASKYQEAWTGYETSQTFTDIIASLSPAPSVSALPSPSAEPSSSAVPSLSAAPSSDPSQLPSPPPSPEPSSEPSHLPSPPPSTEPSQLPPPPPSTEPSHLPSSEPSQLPPPPSAEPSSEPSQLPPPPPSIEPSSEPSQLPPPPSSEPSPLPSTEPSAVPSPPPQQICNDHNEALTCQLAGRLGICEQRVPHSENSVKDLCPLSCGCCSIDNECVCDNNAAVHSITSRYHIGWLRTCQQVLRYVSCDSYVFRSLLSHYCPCACHAQ